MERHASMPTSKLVMETVEAVEKVAKKVKAISKSAESSNKHHIST